MNDINAGAMGILNNFYTELRRRSGVDVASNPTIDNINHALNEIEKRAVKKYLEERIRV